ncbi:MAG: hypothetical protein ACREBF_01165 [Candidatus Micrarchaeales archaeon]
MPNSKENFLQLHKVILSLRRQIINEVTLAIAKKVSGGQLDDYQIVWNQLQIIATPVIKNVLKRKFKGAIFIEAKSKSTYPDLRMEWQGFKVAIDIKSNESSKDPWYDIARLDTIIETRINQYDEEYEVVIKYDSKTKKLIKIFFDTLRDTVGIRKECNGVKYRPYDGKLRPKTWKEFDENINYWKTKEEFLKGIENSKKHRWKESAKQQLKHLSKEEKKEFRDLYT